MTIDLHYKQNHPDFSSRVSRDKKIGGGVRVKKMVGSSGGAHRVLLIPLAMLVMGTTGSGQRTALPVKLENYVNSAGRLSAQERQLLVAGQPVTKLLDADESKEVVAVLSSIERRSASARIRVQTPALRHAERRLQVGQSLLQRRRGRLGHAVERQPDAQLVRLLHPFAFDEE